MARSRARCVRPAYEIRLDRELLTAYLDNSRNVAITHVMDQKHAIAALGALAQETRLELFRLLVTCGPEGMPAGRIGERLSVPPSSLSFHLQQLAHAGLITQRRSSRQLIYSAEYGAMNELLAYLTENCCGRGVPCVPACNPADTFTKGESDEAPARARRR